MEIDRDTDHAGIVPSGLWVAMFLEDREEGREDAIVVFVGLQEVVDELDETLWDLVPPVGLPNCTVALAHSRRRLGLGVMVLGKWPSYEKATEVAAAVRGKVGDGPAQWSEQIAKLDPATLPPRCFQLRDDIVTYLADLFLDECSHAMEIN